MAPGKGRGKRLTRSFREDIRRGREFEAEERAGWDHFARKNIQFEASTAWGTKHGRIDIKIDEGEAYIAVVEIKATDWDRLAPGRIRPTAQRHARQIWRYINDYVEIKEREVCPGIVYEWEPEDPRIRTEVETILNDRCIQVVWRKERRSSPV